MSTLQIDITGLESVAGDNFVIGNDASEANSYLGQLTNAVNGYIWKVEMSCVKSPGAGEPDLNLVADVTATTSGVAATDITLIDRAGDWIQGDHKINVDGPDGTPWTNNLNNYYLHLVAGKAGGSAATYTTGKFVIKLFGFKTNVWA